MTNQTPVPDDLTLIVRGLALLAAVALAHANSGGSSGRTINDARLFEKFLLTGDIR